jgi:hypothetical protein
MLHLKNFFTAVGEYAPYIAGLVVAFWMSWTGRASPRLPLTIAFLFGIALFLLSQNTQAAGLPSTVVIVTVLYDQLRQHLTRVRIRDAAPLLLALLVFPAFAIGASSVAIAGYHAKASRPHLLFVAGETNVRDLAVPAGERGAFASFSRGGIDFPLRGEAGELVPRYELSQYEYMRMLLEAARLLAGRPPGGIAVFDQVNPLPFMLGVAPARGANLWAIWSAPRRLPAEYLAEVRYVLVPKFSSNINWTKAMTDHYRGYLSEHFQQAVETPTWRLLERKPERTPWVDFAPAIGENPPASSRPPANL